MAHLRNPSHPGEAPAERYLAPLDMSAFALATRLDVPRTRIERLVKGETALSVDTAPRLSKFFRATVEFWIDLQRAHDLAKARDTVDLPRVKPPSAA